MKETLKFEEEKGALVGDVTAGGPAQKAGIQRGDVIVAFDGKESKESGELPYRVAAGGPAANGGIQAGDVILEVNQEAVKDLSQFNRKIKGTKAGDTILLLIDRKGATLFLTLKNG